MNENLKIVFGLFGGLALFLYGMNSMSDALQKAAGEKMKKVLAFLTKNPIMGALAGALVTAVLQSSSATTVMVIGFVSAGLMSLPQAISVIFGANIGTTMTAQLMAFKISNYIYPIIFIGFIMNFVCKKEKIKNVGMVLFSFGLLFEGIEIMGGVMKPLASSPVFVDMMGKVKDMPILGVGLGALMTVVVQSSSATIAVLQNFASQAGPDGVTSVIGLAGAIPILLGDNIGTTITALLASIGQSKNAKRTAIAHSVFNITGSAVFLFLIPVLSKFVQYVSPKGNEVDVISRQIANAHTTFNIVCTLIWLPLIPIMVKIVRFIIRGEDKKITMIFEPKYLDEKVIAQPAAAIYLVSKEMCRLESHMQDMMKSMKDGLPSTETVISEKYNAVYHAVKGLQDAIVQYMTKMFANGNLTEKQAEQTTGLLYINNNLEHITDQCENIEEIIMQIQSKQKKLSKEAQSEIGKCISHAQAMLENCMKAVQDGNDDKVQEVLSDLKKMKKLEKQNNKHHLARVKDKKCAAISTSDYARIMEGFERIAYNCVNISEEVKDDIVFQNLSLDMDETETQQVLKVVDSRI